EVGMKVIFWDIDGVLNSPGTWGQWAKDGDWSKALNPRMVARARDVVSKTGAKCVLSSTWRFATGYDRTLDALAVNGWTTAREDFIGETPVLHTQRGIEIGEWLLANPHVTDYVIVDDDSDMTTHVHRLVRTQFE